MNHMRFGEMPSEPPLSRIKSKTQKNATTESTLPHLPQRKSYHKDTLGCSSFLSGASAVTVLICLNKSEVLSILSLHESYFICAKPQGSLGTGWLCQLGPCTTASSLPLLALSPQVGSTLTTSNCPFPRPG